MQTRINTFPIHDIIIAAFRKSPEAGKDALNSVLKHAKTTTASKLQLMARLFGEVGEKASLLVSSSLPLHTNELISVLPAVQLPTPEQLNNFIQLLHENKILKGLSKENLYAHIIDAYDQRHDIVGKIYFSELTLRLPSVCITMKHSIHIYLVKAYNKLNTTKAAEQHINDAYQLETTGKFDEQYIKNSGIVSTLLKSFQRSLESHPNQPDLLYLNTAMMLAPKQPQVLTTISDYVDHVINRARIEPNIDLNLLNIACMFAAVGGHEKGKFQTQQLMLLIPNTPEQQWVQAKYYFDNGQYTESIEAARAVLEKNPQDVSALYVLGNSLWHQQKYIEAVIPFQAILDMKDLPLTTHQEALSALSSVFFNQGNYTKAINYSVQALEINPEDLQATINQIMAYDFLANTREAQRLYKKALIQFPNEPELDKYRRIHFLDDMSPLDEKKTDPIIILDEINFHINNKQYDLAQKKATALLERGIYITDAHIVMSGVYYHKGNYDKSLLHLNAAKDEGNCPEEKLAFHLMDTYCALEKYQDAEKQAWIILNNNDLMLDKVQRIAAYSALFFIYSAQGKYDQGIQAMTDILNKKNQVVRDQQNLYYYLAIFHYKLGHYSETQVNAHLSIRLSPDTVRPETYLLLAHSCFNNNNMHETLQWLEKFVKIEKNEIGALIFLGKAYYSLSDSELNAKHRALYYFSKALDIDPSCIAELSTILPANIIQELQNECVDPILDTNIESVTFNSTSVILSTSAFSMSSSAEIKDTESRPVALSTEQLMHRLIQIEKKRLTKSLPNDAFSEEQSMPSWNVPRLGLVQLDDARVAQISYANHARANSHFYAILDSNHLKNTCEPDLLNKWQGLISSGKAVGKYSQQGIRFLTSQESAKVTPTIGSGYVAKLKLLGIFGDVRAYGKLIASRSSEREKLVCFDAVIRKSHF